MEGDASANCKEKRDKKQITDVGEGGKKEKTGSNIFPNFWTIAPELLIIATQL